MSTTCAGSIRQSIGSAESADAAPVPAGVDHGLERLDRTRPDRLVRRDL